MALSTMKPNSDIANLISNARATKLGAVSAVHTVTAHLLKFDLAYRLQIPPSQMGTSTYNRDGYGLSPITVHNVGKKIAQLGFCWEACSHAICIEDDRKSTIAIFSEMLSKRNPGLAPMLKSLIKYGSLSCSHTTHFCAAAVAGVPSTDPYLSVDGRLSQSLIGGRCANFSEAMTKGLKWLVLKSEVQEMYPDFCPLVQYAMNAIGAVNSQESEMQLMMAIQNEAEVMHHAQGSIDWKSLGSNIGQRMNQHAADAKSYTEFVRRWGGGIGGKFIQDLYRFHQLFVQDGRIISISTIETLAYLKLSVEHTSPFFVMSVIKAQATCPDTKVHNKVCSLITKSDIASLSGSRLTAMLEAEKIMKLCHGIVETAMSAGWHRKLPFLSFLFYFLFFFFFDFFFFKKISKNYYC